MSEQPVEQSRRRVVPRLLPAVVCAIAALTLGVTLADSTPMPGRGLAAASATPLRTAPPSVPNDGCPAKAQYKDTQAGQDFLCSSAPNAKFYPGPGDVVWARGKGAEIYAENTKPNQIHGVRSDVAYVDSVDCPMHGIPSRTTIPPCAARHTSSVGFASPTSGSSPRDGARSAAPAQIIPASPVDGPATCTPTPADPDVSGDGWIGWAWQQPGPCYYLIPPDVHCTETDGQPVVNAQAPQMAAVDMNPKIVDWQFVAWSMIIYKQDTSTTPATWKVIQQTPFYWSKPTDLFDLPLSAVAPNNWRLFSPEQDATPAFATHAGTFRLPSLGTYTFNFSYQWYGAPADAAGLKPLPEAAFLEFVSGYHLNARPGKKVSAKVVPVYPNLTNLAWDPAACSFH